MPAAPTLRPSARGEPAWELLEVYPVQGRWTEEDDLALTTNRRIEFVDGVLEFLPMPTRVHESAVEFLFRRLDRLAEVDGLGTANYAGTRVRQYNGKYRLPDVSFMLRRNEERILDECWVGADLVVEVVSPDDPDRDYGKKRTDHARTGIPEYWIVDPRPEFRTVTVLTLPDGADEYAEHGVFTDGRTATSVLLDGFGADVTACPGPAS